MSLSKKDAILLLSFIILFIASVITLAMIFVVRYNSRQVFDFREKQIPQENIVSEPEYIYFSQLTGLGVLTEPEVAPRTVAVMINNNPDGYPVVGINDASIVYEAPVEGSFTRFMAIYSEFDNPEKVGPVRSARPYYLDWLQEYGTALYMHCGGSSDALSEIKKRLIFDADEFSRTPYYWRDRVYIAPHNLFTSGDKWREYIDNFSGRYEFSDWQSWAFGDLNTTSSETNSAVAYAYGKNNVVGWRYEPEQDLYVRTFNGDDFFDDIENPIVADNIIIQFASIRILDVIGRRSITTIGEGEARVLRNGQLIRVSWKKEKSVDRTRFYDAEGQEILLKPGRTWVMIVPKGASLNITN